MARLAQQEADKRTDAREAKFAAAQSQIDQMPPGPHREAVQTFPDDARSTTWQVDD